MGTEIVHQGGRKGGQGRAQPGVVEVLDGVGAGGAAGGGQEGCAVVAHGSGHIDPHRLLVDLEGGVEEVVDPGDGRLHPDPGDPGRVGGRVDRDPRAAEHRGEHLAIGIHPQPVVEVVLVRGAERRDELLAVDELGGKAARPQQGDHQGRLVEVVAGPLGKGEDRPLEGPEVGDIIDGVVDELVDQRRIVL